jgi:homoserine O-acetyltransferase
MKPFIAFATLFWSVSAFAQVSPAGPSTFPQPVAQDFTAQDFQFKTGERVDVRIHYYTLGSPVKRADGKVGNAVLVLHGTGGSGRPRLINPTFAGMLFCSGCLLDATKYFIISPDNLGHGSSSKPSDGMRMGFPHYDDDDMVALQHKVLTEGLNVDHLRLVIGTSMGCMHSWLWAEQYPDFIDAAMPLACLPVEIAGRNRMWRKMLIDGIRSDPAWNNGNYTQQPQQGLRVAEYLLIIAGSAPLFLQMQNPTRDAVDRSLDQRFSAAMQGLDANDLLYQYDASRNYNPAPKLESIRAPVMAVNSADDFVNPPELGILEREIKRVKRGCAVVLAITDQTRGHGTQNLAAIWGNYLDELLEKSGGLAPGTSWSGSRAVSADRKLCSVGE